MKDLTDNKMPCAIITGIHGQDGFYLAKLLLEKGYRVVGIQRRTSASTGWRLTHIPGYEKVCAEARLIIEAGDITDLSSIARVVAAYKPDEFYNLAAQSQVWHSFKAALSTLEITGLGAAVCLEAVRQWAPNCKFYQAGSSEQFGNSAIFGRDKPKEGVKYERILNEDSPMIPRSPYGVAKLAAYALVRNYREAYGMFAVGGILFNHESPYRGVEFVTRKITHGIAAILAGEQKTIELGNLDAYRDWGHAEDYMRAAWMMLQQDKPKDYVISMEKTFSIRDFLDLAFSYVNIDDWSGHVEINPEFVRPSEIDVLIGDSTLAHDELGWRPKHSFKDLVYSMIYHDCLRKGVVNMVKKQDEFGI
ncbi:MAG: GDP-mannose 4,6-dehydratase [Candidatus Thorarchaeota archaeon]